MAGIPTEAVASGERSARWTQVLRHLEAGRHGRVLRADEPLAEAPLRTVLARTGWDLDRYDDAVGRFFARATRAR